MRLQALWLVWVAVVFAVNGVEDAAWESDLFVDSADTMELLQTGAGPDSDMEAEIDREVRSPKRIVTCQWILTPQRRERARDGLFYKVF
jgi:hypothetical protein